MNCFVVASWISPTEVNPTKESFTIAIFLTRNVTKRTLMQIPNTIQMIREIAG